MPSVVNINKDTHAYTGKIGDCCSLSFVTGLIGGGKIPEPDPIKPAGNYNTVGPLMVAVTTNAVSLGGIYSSLPKGVRHYAKVEADLLAAGWKLIVESPSAHGTPDQRVRLWVRTVKKDSEWFVEEKANVKPNKDSE